MKPVYQPPMRVHSPGVRWETSCPLPEKTQKGSFTVQILHKATKKPLPGCVFQLYSGETSVARQTTDARGEASFANLEPGAYTLARDARTWAVTVSPDGGVTIA